MTGALSEGDGTPIPEAASGVAIDSLEVRYPGRAGPALHDISLDIAPGEVVTVAGRTGAGKSTLALAAAGFIPRVVRAQVRGGVTAAGVDVLAVETRGVAGRVGIVFATPANQLSASKLTVREELAFGLENLGLPRATMDERIDAVLDRLGIRHLADREPLALSGGEQQRVAIASIVTMGTQVLVLDEPTAQLDPQGTGLVADLLAELADDGSVVLVAEHAAEVLARGRRCLVLDAGAAASLDIPGRALAPDTLVPLGLHPPTLVALAELASVPPERAFDEHAIADALRSSGPRIRDVRATRTHGFEDIPEPAPGEGVEIVVDGLVHRYSGGVEALRGVDLRVGPGETVAIVGRNGSGKTTLAKHLNGLLRPDEGHILLNGVDTSQEPVHRLAARVGFVFQHPDDQLFERSVAREVAFGPRNLGRDAGAADAAVERALAAVGLLAERATNPYDLDVSLRKLVALASILAMDPAVLVLDEPTTGQDGPGVGRVGAVVDTWARAGRTVIAITHDLEFAATHFSRLVVMSAGRIMADGPPAHILAASSEELLADAGLSLPPAARVGGLLGLEATPTFDSLIGALASRTATAAVTDG